MTLVFTKISSENIIHTEQPPPDFPSSNPPLFAVRISIRLESGHP